MCLALELHQAPQPSPTSWGLAPRERDHQPCAQSSNKKGGRASAGLGTVSEGVGWSGWPREVSWHLDTL